MNIGLLTLQSNWNYGNRLQNYALSRVLTNNGCTVTSLKLRRLNDAKRVLKASAKKMFRNVGIWNTDVFEKRATMSEKMTGAHKEHFNHFNDALTIESVGRGTAYKLLGRFDALIVGSDQVWNPDLTIDELNWFLLIDAPKVRRIAYAASFGVESIARQLEGLYRKGLEGFDALSVREESGADIVGDLVGNRPAVTLDPTMLLSPDDWIGVSDNKLIPACPYVFTYFLGGISPYQKTYIDQFANSGFKIVSIGGSVGTNVPAGPQDFIALAANASHVITNSFHGAVFASLFNTPLTILQRIEDPTMHGRIDTLCSKFGLTSNLYENTNYSENTEFNLFNQVIQQERVRSTNWLIRNIN